MLAADLHHGDRVTWMCTSHNNYGFCDPVAALVEKVNDKRITIRVAQKRAGQWVEVFKSVKPEKLRPRSPENYCPELGEQPKLG